MNTKIITNIKFNCMSYKFFSNKKCEYYPCHKLKKQNCLFCFCPLYFFKDCGGNFKYIFTQILADQNADKRGFNIREYPCGNPRLSAKTERAKIRANQRISRAERGLYIKDCSDCLLPHSAKRYNYIIFKIKQKLNKTKVKKSKR